MNFEKIKKRLKARGYKSIIMNVEQMEKRLRERKSHIDILKDMFIKHRTDYITNKDPATFSDTKIIHEELLKAIEERDFLQYRLKVEGLVEQDRLRVKSKFFDKLFPVPDEEFTEEFDYK